ncbi:hypothetical protein TTHERM_01445930 (macronuclear) [Tetrahymena thermophila SB210]|uniref:Uncharacterized protein n=1 Tax=Tetrahymena thermophila (strain SB210) TaxID=312017 RepID=Q229A8_TETTS|nr:hypothetical protein TTHERM_01445930 [Tetrahymena thermophila SB210]EAR81874.1 hypothetical protein TTHERM_01445930 [Tetrahymena thermophila SB210]|eukprot:XP_001029537.1 hypothetical protein TTHERM_01445930 [Tetrahymena thermophila SB210]
MTKIADLMSLFMRESLELNAFFIYFRQAILMNIQLKQMHSKYLIKLINKHQQENFRKRQEITVKKSGSIFQSAEISLQKQKILEQFSNSKLWNGVSYQKSKA